MYFNSTKSIHLSINAKVITGYRMLAGPDIVIKGVYRGFGYHNNYPMVYPVTTSINREKLFQQLSIDCWGTASASFSYFDRLKKLTQCNIELYKILLL